MIEHQGKGSACRAMEYCHYVNDPLASDDIDLECFFTLSQGANIA